MPPTQLDLDLTGFLFVLNFKRGPLTLPGLDYPRALIRVTIWYANWRSFGHLDQSGSKWFLLITQHNQLLITTWTWFKRIWVEEFTGEVWSIGLDLHEQRGGGHSFCQMLKNWLVDPSCPATRLKNSRVDRLNSALKIKESRKPVV